MKLRGLYAITPEEAGMLDKVRRALEGGAKAWLSVAWRAR